MSAVADHRLLKSATLSLPLSRWSVKVATCGGLGYLPGYPWLSGALVVSLLTPFVLWPLYGWGGPWLVGLAALLATCFGARALADIARHGQPSDDDARPVVIDELAGAALTLALGWPWLHHFAGPAFGGYVPLHLLYLGLLFRVMDIVKPWPAAWFDLKGHGPLGIIADDLVAALYAALVAPLPFMLLN
jgi:phosphatidylglycerophosphatase A